MTDLTDYEINRRLAEIAGVEVVSIFSATSHGKPLSVANPNTLEVVPLSEDLQSVVAPSNCVRVGPYIGREPAWSPLTDWSQLGPLMEQMFAYALPCQPEGGGDWWWEGHCEAGPPSRSEWVYPRCPDKKRAICLAIIAAHEGSNPHQDDEPSDDAASGLADQDAIKGEA